jgi:hypothetical protein
MPLPTSHSNVNWGLLLSHSRIAGGKLITGPWRGTRKENCRTERSLLGFNNFDRQL